MPLIHFAFGELHRSGQHVQQLNSFVEHILLPRRFRSFKCPEFLPILNNPNALFADPDSAVPTGDGGVTFTKYVPAPPVSLLPIDVWMTSFVDIPFKKLPQWAPAGHYGCLGIALTDQFRRRNKVRRVSYYQYPNLAVDPFVIALNEAINTGNATERDRLDDLVGKYRKPARLWPELNGLFAMLKLTAHGNGDVTIDKLTYSRYESGYDFEIENEARLVTGDQTQDIEFFENEVLALIAPNEEVAQSLRSLVEVNWKVHPKVIVFPTLGN